MTVQDNNSGDGKKPRGEIVLAGLGVSHGIAMGPAYLVQIERPRAPRVEIADTEVTEEVERFDAAVRDAIENLEKLKLQSSNLPDTAAEEVGLLLDAHLAMLAESRLVKGVRKRIAADHINAEYATQLEIKALADQFAAMEDPYLAARIDDIEAVGTRLIRVLMNLPWLSLGSVPQGGIVLAAEITPADTALLDPRKFGGIATVHGGAAGHTAVMARGLGLPAVLGISGLLEQAHHGDMAIIDGITGKVILNPAESTLENYQRRLDALKDENERLGRMRDLPAVTTDGVDISLQANIEMPRDLDSVLAAGAQGIGLFRTEFMFMNKPALPDEDEQFEEIVGVVKGMQGRPVTFRTLDIGGDKLARALGDHMADCDNPALGLRGVRLSLKETELLKSQYRAIIRAGAYGPVRILLPLVTTAAEMRTARQLLYEAEDELKKRGDVKLPEKTPPLGTMIEIPAAALAADSLAAVSDFFSLGTNDLIQYTVAIDRGNDQVAFLYDPLNPAVLRLIEFTVQAALRARIPVSICGEMAADTQLTALLMGIGITEFSVGYASLPAVKSRMREINMEAARRHARQVMDQYDSGRIITLVNDFNG